MPVDNMGQPRTAPQPNPVQQFDAWSANMSCHPTRLQCAAPESVGPGQYQVCTQQVTDRCVNPNDIRRGIAKRPARR